MTQDELQRHAIAEMSKPQDGLCANCHKRPGTETWVGEGGTLAYVHGMYALWCKRCCLEKQIEHAETCAASLPDLRRQLAEVSHDDA